MASEAKRPSAVRSAVKGFVETTSIKGVTRAVKSRSAFLRGVWLVAVLCGLSLAIYQLAVLFRNYYARETTSTIKEYEINPQYPDITVCNLNPLAIGDINGVHMRDYFEIMHATLDDRDIDESFGDYTGDSEQYTSADIQRAIPSLLSLSGFFQNVDLSNISFDKLEHFMISCRWYDWTWREVYQSDCKNHATAFFSPDYYLCHTIHLPEKLSTNNPIRGMAMILYLKDIFNDTMPFFTHSLVHSKASGVRLTTQYRDTIPDTRDGIIMAPGHEVTVQIAEHKRIRRPAPYGVCEDRLYLNNTPGILYTREACQAKCYQTQILDKCGCLSANAYMGYPGLEHHSGDEFCGKFPQLVLSDESDPMLERSNSSSFTISAKDVLGVSEKVLCSLNVTFNPAWCSCPIPCNSTHYEQSVSQAPWPHPSYADAFYSKYIVHTELARDLPGKDAFERGKDGVRETTTTANSMARTLASSAEMRLSNSELLDLIKRNFLQVNVYYDEQIYRVLENTASVTPATLWATIGGALNLWIGITFMTLIELLEVGYNLLAAARCSKVDSREQGEPGESDSQADKQRQAGFNTNTTISTHS